MGRLKIYLTAMIGTALIAAMFVSCDLLTEDKKDEPPQGSSESRTVMINVSAGETIYLVKYNPGPNEVPAQYTGNARSASLMTQIPLLSENRLPAEGQPAALGLGQGAGRHKAATEFNANPPEFSPAPRRMARSVMPAEGQSRQFWVQDGPYDNSRWIQINATLKKNGAKCRIWVADSNFAASSTANNDNKITAAQAQTLADKFDSIYDKETALFGYEYGGGTGGNGGADSDPLIQILVYDIDSDYASNQTGGTLGFFWGKDEYRQAYLEDPVQDAYTRSLKSNEAEIFYLDAHLLDKMPDMMYSTLIHEFQHMIQFNEKFIKKGLNSETWYNEMLSMLAEDTLDRHIGIAPPANITVNSGHPIHARMPSFIRYYWASGVTDWLGGNNVNISYANAYAFGAYLARNYGGAKLLYEMAHNNYANIDSVNAALAAAGGANFTAALERFPQALLNRTGAGASFNRTGAAWVSPPSGITASDYTFAAFDIGADVCVPSSPQPMRPYGIAIERLGTADSASPASVTITYRADSPVKMYLLGKKTTGAVAKKGDVLP